MGKRGKRINPQVIQDEMIEFAVQELLIFMMPHIIKINIRFRFIFGLEGGL